MITFRNILKEGNEWRSAIDIDIDDSDVREMTTNDMDGYKLIKSTDAVKNLCNRLQIPIEHPYLWVSVEDGNVFEVYGGDKLHIGSKVVKVYPDCGEEDEVDDYSDDLSDNFRNRMNFQSTLDQNNQSDDLHSST